MGKANRTGQIERDAKHRETEGSPSHHSPRKLKNKKIKRRSQQKRKGSRSSYDRKNCSKGTATWLI